jgi:hypothetical protein
MAWFLWTQGCGLGVIALGIGYLLVSFFTYEGPVSVHTQQNLLTNNIIVGRSLIYTVRVDRREACPSTITDTWNRNGLRGTREQIIVNRAIITTNIAVTPVLKISVALPEAVTAGTWHYVSVLDSNCPTRNVIDKIADFDVNVLNPENEAK